MITEFFPVAGSHWQTYKKPGLAGPGGIRKLKPAPKPQQLLYCDVCKISCGGPQVGRKNLIFIISLIYFQRHNGSFIWSEIELMFLQFCADLPRTSGGTKTQKEGSCSKDRWYSHTNTCQTQQFPCV